MQGEELASPCKTPQIQAELQRCAVAHGTKSPPASQSSAVVALKRPGVDDECDWMRCGEGSLHQRSGYWQGAPAAFDRSRGCRASWMQPWHEPTRPAWMEPVQILDPVRLQQRDGFKPAAIEAPRNGNDRSRYAPTCCLLSTEPAPILQASSASPRIALPARNSVSMLPQHSAEKLLVRPATGKQPGHAQDVEACMYRDEKEGPSR